MSPTRSLGSEGPIISFGSEGPNVSLVGSEGPIMSLGNEGPNTSLQLSFYNNQGKIHKIIIKVILLIFWIWP